MDIFHPLNPANPIGLLNPASPLSPMNPANQGDPYTTSIAYLILIAIAVPVVAYLAWRER